jgi:PHP family Zn ribbon phosphoesterase
VSVHGLLANLAKKRITLFLEGERLRYRAPEGALTSELRQAITKNRAAIIEGLRVRQLAKYSSAKCETCERRFWVDDPPREGRILTTCGRCGRFIGYRPAR